MRPERSVTLYHSSLNSLIDLAISISFVLCAAVIVLVERPLQQSDAIMAWFTIGFFGLCVVVFMRALRSDRRAPLLRVTPEGMACVYSRFPLPEMGWGDIQALVIYQKPWSRKPKEPVYYLAILARRPEALRDPEEDESVEWPLAPALLPEEERIAMLIPLAEVFNSPTPQKVRARTLDRIQSVFAPEIARYGVVVEPAIREASPVSRA